MTKLTKFFYSFNVLQQNEEKFVNYMNDYGIPVMSKYCKNWQLFKQKSALRGDNPPQYIGYFEIPDIDSLFKTDPPEGNGNNNRRSFKSLLKCKGMDWGTNSFKYLIKG